MWLFLKKLWNNLNAKILFCHNQSEPQTCMYYGACVRQSCPMLCVCTKCQEVDKQPDVQTRSALYSTLTRGEWYHSPLLEAIYSQQERCCLCFFFSLYLSLSYTQAMKWLVLLWPFVWGISLLSQVLYSAFFDSCSHAKQLLFDESQVLQGWRLIVGQPRS